MTNRSWNGSSADWNVASDWTGSIVPSTADVALLGNTGSYVVSIGTSYGSTEIEQPGSVALTDPNATIRVGTGSTLAVGSVFNLAAGTLALYSGVLQGGTLQLGAGTLAVEGGTLSGVTVEGSLGLASFSAYIVGGLTLETASGAVGGTLALASDSLSFLDSETLDNATILASGYIDSLYDYGQTLTLGRNLTLDATANLVNVSAADLINLGTIAIASGTDLTLSFNGSSFVNRSSISVANGGTLTLDGSLTTAQLQSLMSGISDQGTLILEGTLNNTGTILAASNITQGRLEIAGEVDGGTISNAGSVIFGNGVLSGVTVDGPVVLQPGYDVGIELTAGATLLSATGATGGTLVLGGLDDFLSIGAAETVTNTLIEAQGSGTKIFLQSGAPTLTLGTGTTLDVSGSNEIYATTVVNAGTILVEPGATFDFESGAINNNAGTIKVAAGGTLELDVYEFSSNLGSPFVYSGAVPVLTSGATLVVGGSLTTVQLLSLLNGQSGVTVELLGTLINTLTTLSVGNGLISNLILDGEIVGGTIDNVGGTVAFGTGTLSGVTILGPAIMNTQNATLDVINGITLLGTDGVSPGTLTMTGLSDAIVVGDSETLDNFTVNTTIGSGYYYQPEDFIYGTTLTLGAHATITDGFDLQIKATNLVNFGSLAASNSGGALLLVGNSIVNNGTINIASGAELGVDVGSTLPVSLTNNGRIGLPSGAIFDVGGVASTATIVNLLGTATGVTVGVLGTVQNNGSTITATASGPFGHLLLEGDLIGGTLVNSGGTIQIELGTLDGVTVQGNTTIDGTASLVDGVAFTGSGGTGLGTLSLAGYGGLTLLDSEALANVAISIGNTEFLLTAETPTLSVAQSTTISLAQYGELFLSGTSIANSGTIIAPQGTLNGADVFFGGATIAQNGVVSIGSADVLGLDVGQLGALNGTLNLSGSFSLAAGATLDLGEKQSTSQLTSLLPQLGATNDVVYLTGTLQNSGATLAVAPGLLNTVIIDDDVIGGVIAQNGGTLAIAGGTLDGVQIRGAVTLGASDYLSLRDNPTFVSASGQAGGTLIANGQDSLTFQDGATLDNVAILIGSNDRLELATYTPYAINLGAGATIRSQGQTELYAYNASIANAGTIIVTPGTGAYAQSAYVDLEAPTILNSGFISIASGSALDLDLSGGTQPLAVSNIGAGSINLAVGSTLAIGASETNGQLISLLGSVSQPGVVVDLAGTIVNTGTTLNLTAGGLLGTVVLAGSIVGGTVNAAGASIDYLGAVLAATTWDGPLTVANPSDRLTLENNTTFLSASGNGPGTLALTGSGDSLTIQGASTLDQLSLTVSGKSDGLSFSTLTLGSGAQTNVTGNLTATGTLLTNLGTISVAGSAASLLIQAPSFANQGLVTVGSNDVLGIGAAFGNQGISVSGTGFALAAGATLEVGGSITTAQLLSLLGSISNPNVVVDVVGTLVNTGATLGAGTSSLLDNLILNGDVIGGAIAPGSGTIALAGGTLDGVTVLGSVALSGYQSTLNIRDALTLAGGTLALSGIYDTLNLLDAETIDNGVIAVSGFGDAITGSTIGLGASLALNITGGVTVNAATLANAGTINLSGSQGYLVLSGTSVTNNGIINIGSASLLDLGSAYAGETIALGGTGSSSLAVGSTLEIGGTLTTAQLLAELSTLSQPGVVIELNGVINNTGTVLDAKAGGLLGQLILNGAEIIGGTIDADTGSITVLGGDWQGVTYQGPLQLQGRENDLFVSGGLVVETTAGALPGTIIATPGLNFIDFLAGGTFGTGLTLSNVILQGTSAFFGFVSDTQTNDTLVINQSVTSDAHGVVFFDANTIANAGTLVAQGAGDGLAFVEDTFSNTGTILVSPGAGVAFGNTATFNNKNGTIALASGATLAVISTITTSELITFADSLVTNPGVVVAIGYTSGTLENIGTTLTITPTGPLSDFGLGAGGVVLGGTIVNQGTAGFLGQAVLDNVTWIGPLAVSLAQTSLLVGGTSTIMSGGTGPAGIALSGSADSLVFDPTYVPDYGLGGPSGVLSQTVTNSLITLSAPGTATSESLLLEGPGTLTFAPGVTIAATGNAVIEASGGTVATALLNQGSIISTGGLLTFESYPQISSGLVSIVNTGVIQASGAGASGQALNITGAFVNAGLIEVSGANSFVVGNGFSSTNFANTGSVILANGATLDLVASVANAGTIVMADGAETVRVDATGSLTATILDFQVGDTIDLRRVVDNATIAATGTFAAGTLDIYSGTSLAAVFLLPSFAYNNSQFSVSPDSHGGTVITTTTPCFHAGTRIRTTSGEIAVEALQVGMHVPTLTGETRPIVWIGQRAVDCARHCSPASVLPIRVFAGAFGTGRPERDLVLSPDHAIWQDGVLIPIQYLVNGVTICRENVTRAHYFHVELDAHAVLFAEGLPAESYLDTGNRASFANGAEAVSLFADFAARDWAGTGAPLCVSGAKLIEIRRHLFADLPSVEMPPPYLRAGHLVLRAVAQRGESLSFVVPAGLPEVTIVSGVGVPSELDPDSNDRRALGVAIGGLVLAGRLIALTDPALGDGFYPLETDRRWTNGSARLRLPRSSEARILEIRVVQSMRCRPAGRLPDKELAASA